MFYRIKSSLSNFNISARSIIKIGFSDIIDILIMAFLIYLVMMWIRESRAWSLLKGFLVILLASLLAYFFNLTTVTWLIENTFNVGIIALIIIFQPELRKALEQLGKTGFIYSISVKNKSSISEHAANELVTAILAMSRVKTGALIVIEKNIPLADLEQTGIRIDAELSSQLLINIFENKTPLHDGAVIIKNNRIVAATCILPLTSTKMDKSLGTRHRAALGSSEASDGQIIVVSEETGDISIAQDGKLYRKLDEKKLKDMLFVDEEPGTKNSLLALRKGRKDKNGRKN